MNVVEFLQNYSFTQGSAKAFFLLKHFYHRIWCAYCWLNIKVKKYFHIYLFIPDDEGTWDLDGRMKNFHTIKNAE